MTEDGGDCTNKNFDRKAVEYIIFFLVIDLELYSS